VIFINIKSYLDTFRIFIEGQMYVLFSSLENWVIHFDSATTKKLAGKEFA